MKTIILSALLSFLLLSGLAFATQSEGEKGDFMQGMEEMMRGEKGMEGMGGMMRMMKMMDQCSAMMESAHAESGKAKEKQQREKK